MLFNPQGPAWKAALEGLEDMYARTRAKDEAARLAAEQTSTEEGPAPSDGTE